MYILFVLHQQVYVFNNEINKKGGDLKLFLIVIKQIIGVAILLNNNFESKVHNVHKDCGHYIILDITIENINLLLVIVYGSNLDTPHFYSEIIGTCKIESCLNTQHIIIGVILIYRPWNVPLNHTFAARYTVFPKR